MVGDNNFGENLVIVHEVENNQGEKFLVCAAPLGKPEDKKQICQVDGKTPRNGKHCYFSGL